MRSAGVSRGNENLERHEILRPEAEVDGLELANGPEKESSADEQQQRQRKLARHERLAGSRLARCRARASERAIAFGPVNMQRRREPEENRGGRRDCRRKAEDGEVGAQVECQRNVGLGQQRHQQIADPGREKHTARGAGNRQHQAFGQHLADDAGSARADGESQCDFVRTSGVARHHQVRDIGARNQQHQDHDGEK